MYCYIFLFLTVFFYFWSASNKSTLLKMSLCKNFALHEKMKNCELQKKYSLKKKTKVRFEISATKWSKNKCLHQCNKFFVDQCNHLIIEENSFTVQLTFSDGNCSSSIYLLAFHLCFVSKTLNFCLQITCIHVCWSYCFFMTFGHSTLVRQQKCNY